MSYLTDHAADLFARSEYDVAATSFLSPAEQREIFDALPNARARLVFWGGALGCERRCAFFVPEWALDAARSDAEYSRAAGASGASDDGADGAEHAHEKKRDSASGGDLTDLAFPAGLAFPANLASLGAFADEREAAAAILDRDGSLVADRLSVAHVEGSAFRSLSHRDFMGSILNLGIKREALGDIVVLGDHAADAYCTDRAAAVIKESLGRIGRDGVRVSVRRVGAFERVEREYETLTLTVASLRLDCVVGELANASREGAKKLIASGSVEVDHREAADADLRLAEGAVLSIRGRGKYVVGAVTGTTRKDRLRLTVKRYV